MFEGKLLPVTLLINKTHKFKMRARERKQKPRTFDFSLKPCTHTLSLF